MRTCHPVLVSIIGMPVFGSSMVRHTIGRVQVIRLVDEMEKGRKSRFASLAVSKTTTTRLRVRIAG